MANLPISGLPGGTPADANVLAQEVPGVATQKVTFTQVKTYLNGVFLQISNNLSDLGNLNTALTNLGATSANTANALVRRDASGNFSMGTLTGVGATFTGGNLNLTGTNPAFIVGTNANFGQSSASGAFFSGSVNGDTILRQSNTSFSLLMGVGNGTAQQQITNTAINFRVNPNITAATNPSLNISNFNVAQATSGGAFFSDAVSGDCILRQNSTSNSVRVGVGSATTQFVVSNAQINANVGILFPTTGGTAAALNYYEESVASPLSMSTPDGTNHNLNTTFTRIGKLVVVEFPQLSVTSNSSAKFVAAAGQIPTRFRPLITVTHLDDVVDAGGTVLGRIDIGVDGSMTGGVGAASANFQNSGLAAIGSFSVSYLVA